MSTPQRPNERGTRATDWIRTNDLRFTIGGTPAIVSGATSTLTISEALSFGKAFDADVVAPGDSVALEFTIGNAHPTLMAEELAFTDDLDAVISGLIATGTPIDDVCGEGSVLDASSVLMLRNGSVGPGESCTFDVTVEARIAANPGDYENLTSELLTDEGVVGDAATATLTVVPGTADGGERRAFVASRVRALPALAPQARSAAQPALEATSGPMTIHEDSSPAIR